MARPIGQVFEVAASGRVLRRSERALAEAPAKWRKAANRTLKRVIRSGRAAASTEIRKTINLKKKAVDARIIAEVVSVRGLTASVAVRDKRIPLVDFMTPAQIATAFRRQNARGRGRGGKRTKGVKVKARRDQSAKVYPDTFVNIGINSGKWHVLKRQGRERYPAYIQFGPRLTEEFEKKLPVFAESQAANLEKIFDRELNFALRDL